jgi:hypothetical protein
MTNNFAGMPSLLAKARAGASRWSGGLAALATAAGVMIATAAPAAPLEVALVESLTGSTSAIEYMDYLKPGQVIRLGARDTLVLTYMTSCVRETIRGGTVTIGTDASDVQSGEVVRIKGQCGVGRIVLTGAQTAIGGRSFRGPSH